MNSKIIFQRIVKPSAFIIALIPLFLLIRKAYSVGLGANPAEKLLHYMGDWALNFLMITLVISPVQQITGFKWPMHLRRMTGLFSFFYATLHLITYVVVDQAFIWHDIFEDVMKHKRIIAGLLSYILLIPLAMTSTNRMFQRLGVSRWSSLHRLTYVSAIGVVIHYLLLVKKDMRMPIIYAVILLVLLGIRVVHKVIKRYAPVSPISE